MNLTPAAMFLLIAVPRVMYLFYAENKAKRRATYTPKLVGETPHALLPTEHPS